MLRFLIRNFSSIQHMNEKSNIRHLFFKSNLLTTQEIAEVARKVSDYNILELRKEIGKEDFFKNFFFSLGGKIHLMKSEDIVSLLANFIKNPDFRDYRNTYAM